MQDGNNFSMNINDLPIIRNIGHLSNTSKMPCFSWSLSAFNCKSDDPICKNICYAKKHHYNYKVVKDALKKNEESYLKEDFVNNFTYVLKALDAKYFRFFDSGDLFACDKPLLLLTKITQIAKNNPSVLFWMPTRDKKTLLKFWKIEKKPLKELFPNLIIRLSASDVNYDPDYNFADKIGVNVASVKTEGYSCKAKSFNGNCGLCRQCWNNDIKEVSYYVH